MEEAPSIGSVNDHIMGDSKMNLKALCVSKRKNKFYFPKTIPKERSFLANDVRMFLSLLLFLIHLFISKLTFLEIIFLYTSGVLLSVILQIFHRLILMIEEYTHLTSRYENSFTVMAKFSLNFRPRVWVATVVCFIYWTYYICTYSLAINDSSWSLAFLLTPTIYFIGANLDLNAGPLNDSLWIAENNGLDYGSGMAYSFFYGYLNLVLKKNHQDDKNLKEHMQDYEDKNKVRFSVYKLFILIPKSLNCFDSLKNDNSPSIDESSSLAEKTITVAGVQNRVYKNAVYKIISDKNKKIYVSAEYATPLKTFKNVFDQTGDHSKFYEKHKKDIILQFFLTLKNVLERNGLTECCELIYYEDSYQDDDQTRYYDVGKIILTRLKDLIKNQHND